MNIWIQFGLPISSRRSDSNKRRRKRQTPKLFLESLEGRLLLNADSGSPHVGVDAARDHAAVMALVPVAKATHIAVDIGGRWSNASTWIGEEVPGDDARVHVPAGATVTYDVVSEVAIATLRIDGTFQFDASTDTRLVVDTIVGTMGSEIYVGTGDFPIAADVTAELVFSTGDEIDRTWDPTGISRGLISMGHVEMVGESKENFLSLSAAPLAGDDRLKFDIDVRSPTVNWEVGDRLVLTGTYWDDSGSHEDNSVSHDEVLEITGFGAAGRTVFFRNVTNPEAEESDQLSLLWNHDPPDGFDLDVYAANLTRNVVLRSQHPDTAPTARGHVMFMSPETDIRYVSFRVLGRTDKSRLVTSGEDHFGERIEESVKDTNPRGRYPVHFHQTGLGGNDLGAFVQGSVVVDSPGWGFVAHSSKVRFDNNVSFDVFGSHYVTEAGDEVVDFTGNMAIKSPGLADKDAAHLLNPTRNEKGRRLDFGARGIGFWIHRPGTVQHVDGNVVSGMAGSAFVVYGATDKLKGPKINVENVHPELRHIAGRSQAIAAWKVPIFSFTDNTVFNARSALLVRGHLRDDYGVRVHGHDRHTNFRDLDAWNLRESGVFVSYSSSVTLSDSMFLGTRMPNPRNRVDDLRAEGVGVFVSKSGRNIVLDDIHVESFEYGATVAQTSGHGIGDSYETPFGAAQIHGGYFANNRQHLRAAAARLTNSPRSHLANDNDAPFAPWSVLTEEPYFEPVAGNTAPVAIFAATGVGGLTVEFDGSASYDADYGVAPEIVEASDNTIAFFTWDVNNDGTIDAYGRRPTYEFDKPGSYDVALTVYDSQGATNTITNEIVVSHSDSDTVLKDGAFAHPPKKNWGTVRWYDALVRNPSNSGWWLPGKTNWEIVDQRAMVVQDGAAPGLIQVVHDRRIHQGTHRLSFDAINTEAATLRILVWGASGHFKVSNWNHKAPVVFGTALTTSSQLLLDETLGHVPDWRSHQFDVDFGTGFEFIVVKVIADGVQGTTGIDNVEISSAVSPQDRSGPHVTNVLVNSPDWSSEYRALIPGGDPDGYLIPSGVKQTKTLPWHNIREIVVEFSEPVRGSGPNGALRAVDFQLNGMLHGKMPILAPVNFDPTTNRVRLSVADDLPHDRYVLTVEATKVADFAGNALDGEFAKHQLGISGDGTPGGNFSFDFSVMPGDFNGSGDTSVATEPAVTLSDHFILAVSWMRTHLDPLYKWNADANGDLRVSPADLLVLVTNWQQSFSVPLPATIPDDETQAVVSGDCTFHQTVDLLLAVFEENKDLWVDSDGQDEIAVRRLREALDGLDSACL